MDSYRLIKGRARELNAEWEKNIIGLRKTDRGFEGLVPANETAQYNNCVFDTVTIDDIVIRFSQGGGKK